MSFKGEHNTMCMVSNLTVFICFVFAARRNDKKFGFYRSVFKTFRFKVLLRGIGVNVGSGRPRPARFRVLSVVGVVEQIVFGTIDLSKRLI